MDKSKGQAGTASTLPRCHRSGRAGSERDEPGCARFNVLRDVEDENVYYFYEVYVDKEAVAAHRAAPHYAVWRAVSDTLDGPVERIECRSVFPADPAYWISG